jgi:zinc transport system substrate-binding protein
MWNRFRWMVVWTVLVFSPVFFLGCGRRGASGTRVRLSVTVTSSLFESAIDGLLTGVEGVRVTRIIEPGACPGHFDITPGQLEQVRKSDLFVLYDFQKYLEERMLLGTAGPRVLSVTAPKGLCIPEGYEDMVRDIAIVLAEILPDKRSTLEGNSRRIEKRVRRLAEDVRGSIRTNGLEGVPVLSSAQQEEFCRWLGLLVVGSFARPENLSARDFERLVKEGREKGVRAVVGNLQEGEAAGLRLAEVLGVPAVSFSNFPAMTPEEPDFEALVRGNVRAFLTHLPRKDLP